MKSCLPAGQAARADTRVYAGRDAGNGEKYNNLCGITQFRGTIRG
jgi:hypothetical protein